MAISACEEPRSLIRISGLSVFQRRHVAPATVIDCQSDKVASRMPASTLYCVGHRWAQCGQFIALAEHCLTGDGDACNKI
jgi:hypothetical protein